MAVAHYGDPIGERECFLLIVGHVDKSDARVRDLELF